MTRPPRPPPLYLKQVLQSFHKSLDGCAKFGSHIGRSTRTRQPTRRPAMPRVVPRPPLHPRIQHKRNTGNTGPRHTFSSQLEQLEQGAAS